MSLTVEIRGASVGVWPLSAAEVDAIGRLRAGAAAGAVDAVFGGADAGAGALRTVPREALTSSLGVLLPAARELARGFQVRVPLVNDDETNLVAPAVSGALVGGVFHSIRCHNDDWEIQPTRQRRDGRRADRFREPRDIPTDNMGLIRVEAKQRGGAGLVCVLLAMRSHLRGDKADTLAVRWG